MKRKILKITEIFIDEKLYPRKKVINSLITKYANDMDKGDIFPPVFIARFKNKNYLIDGRHRLLANEERGEDFIQTEIKENFTSWEDMYLASIKSNLKHGRRLNQRDRLLVALKLKEMEFNVDDISKLVGVKLDIIEKTISSNFKHILIKDKIKKGEVPKTISEKMPIEEEIPILDNVSFQINELESILTFIKDTSFEDNRKVNNLLSSIKKWLHKKFPKL